MTSLIDQIKADLEAGTPGRWSASFGSLIRVNAMRDKTKPVVVAGVHKVGCKGGEPYGDAKANARRIARLPDLEAAYIREREAAEELAAALTDNPDGLVGIDTDRVHAALTAYRAAVEGEG